MDMALFEKKKAPLTGTAVQLRDGGRHPFGVLDGYVPLRNGEIALYRAIREAVPIVDAALIKLIRLVGGVRVQCGDPRAQEGLERFLRTVPTGRGQRGVQSFLDCYMDSLLTCGRAVGELVLDPDGREVAALLCGNAADLEIEDKWVLSKLNTLIKEVTENMDAYELGVASAKVYDFIWDTYCDWYIELTKARLYGEDEKSKLAAQKVLVYVLDQFLRLLHPFMPFITEEIWQAIPHEGRFLMLADWPKYDENLNFSVEAAHMESVMNAIRSIRNRRAEMNVPPSKKSTLYVVSDKGEIFRQGTGFICRLAYADQVIICDSDPEGHENMVCVVTNDAKLYIPLEELIDFEKELARIEKEKANCLKQIAMFEGKLSNEAFVSRAPEKVVAEQREKLEKNRALLAQLEESEKRLRR
ncbi:MAG: class I tRNA ligase family protein [Firmicutes bacterium]|nr:class I tRNA ligase family protein [Bacillota bacterium]